MDDEDTFSRIEVPNPYKRSFESEWVHFHPSQADASNRICEMSPPSLPISASEYQRKLNDLEQGKAELLRSVELLDRLGQEFSASADSVIEALRQFKDGRLQWLRKEKEQLSAVVEAAVKEAQTYLRLGTPLTTELAQKLWTLPSHQLPQVGYSLSPPDFQSISQAWVHYSNEIISHWRLISNEKCAVYSQEIHRVYKPTLVCGHFCPQSSLISRWQKCPICPEGSSLALSLR